jgi:formylglycine-generating enzyme required for sulfatase activity
MDDASLIPILEAAVHQATINDRDRRRIQKLLPALRSGALDPDERQDLEDIAADFARQHPDWANASIGDDNTITNSNVMFDAKAGGNITQTNNELVAGPKIVNQFFGGKPPVDGKALLTAYLRRIVENNSDLHLSRMTRRPKSGSGQDFLPPLRLADVYTNMVVDGPNVCLESHICPVYSAEELVGQLEERSLNDVPPERVRMIQKELRDKIDSPWITSHPDTVLTRDELEPETKVSIMVTRPPLAIELIATQSRLVLLGEPGYGSTLLRYLALMLAQHHLNPAVPLPLGWQQIDPPPVPLFCSLAVAADGLHAVKPGVEDDTKVLWNTLYQQIEGVTGQGADLRGTLDASGMVLLLDGLDEISSAPDVDGISLRARMSSAVANLGRQLPRGLPIVVTCRVLPYTQPPDPAYPRNTWQLPRDEGWTMRTIQPFARGQVGQFVRSWYIAATHDAATRYSSAEGAARAERLMKDLEHNRLRVLTRSPLLLTMLAILHYNRREADLPTTDTTLYEECVTLLLERWEPVRTLNHLKLGLLEELGLAESGKNLDDMRSILHRLAFDAHIRPPNFADGRSIIRNMEVEDVLRKTFKNWQCQDIEGKISKFLRVLRENAALLHEVDDESYVFPHMTFQEFLAACHLADTANLKEAYLVWNGPDGDRWRSVLLLFAGRLRVERKVDPMGEDWVQILLRKKTPRDKTDHCADKTLRQRQRDALLAFDCYSKFDRRALLHDRDSEELDALERSLAQSLVTVLSLEPLALTDERVAAGFALGTLYDPRRGVCNLDIDWCDVPSGEYILSSDDDDLKSESAKKNLHTMMLSAFSISRYPVTNAQWSLFLEADGYANKQWWYSGWDLKEQLKWTQPYCWKDACFNAPNQPVVGVSWYEAQAFCAWLSSNLGYRITLPTPAQWEVAAGGQQLCRYAWGNEWDSDRANVDESGLNRTTAVGTYPQGASWCGAIDINGNVWEWTSDDYTQTASHTYSFGITNISFEVSLRGGAWNSNPQQARCDRLFRFNPLDRLNSLGLRLVTSAAKS